MDIVKSWGNNGDVPDDWVLFAIRKLLEAQQYQRTDYKIHTKETSRVADHCSWHALSDPNDASFQRSCKDAVQSHDHNLQCPQCEAIKEFLKELSNQAELLLDKHRQNYEENPSNHFNEAKIKAEQELNEVQQAIHQIDDLKRHQIRATRSERHRIELIQNFDEHKALIWMDYAQKFLATYGRERQDQYFGKKGLSWHITTITTKLDDKYIHATMVHIIESDKQVRIDRLEAF